VLVVGDDDEVFAADTNPESSPPRRLPNVIESADEGFILNYATRRFIPNSELRYSNAVPL